MINWLYITTLDVSLLIGLILLIRPAVRKMLGAQVTYFLWVLPLLRVLMPSRLTRPRWLDEPEATETGINLISSITNDVWYVPAAVPLVETWLAGLVVCAVLQLALQRRFNRLMSSKVEPYHPGNEQISALIRASGLTGNRVVLSERVDAPCISGLLTARIYLPLHFSANYSPTEQYWAIKHELTHFRRGDLWFQFAGELVRALFWFNPIIHLALRSLREDQEMACDQSTLAGCSNEERYQYGKALARSFSPQLIPSTLNFFTSKKERFLMLSRNNTSKFNTAAGLILCAGLAVFTLTSAPVSLAQTEQRPAFGDVYDSNLPKKFTGKIVRVDYGEHYMLLHINAEHSDGTITPWVVEGGSYQEMHQTGLDSNALYPGRYVTVTGYQSKDQSCDPKCKLNGRDLRFSH